jgi:hypothetical protein
MINNRACVYWLVFSLVHSGLGLAASFNVGAGSRVALGEARIDLGCHDLLIQGQLDLEQSVLTQTNDLDNTGALIGGQALLQVSGD